MEHENYEISKSRVYVLTDDQSRITRCEGEYSLPENLDGWTLIDEGYGDKYNLAQSRYFPDGRYTDDGIPRYKLIADASNPYGYSAVLRDEAEIEADSAAIPPPPPSTEERLEAVETNKAEKTEVQAVWDSMAAAYEEGVNEA